MKQKISKACFIRRILVVSNAINASIISLPLGPTPGTPTGMQVLLLIIDTFLFPRPRGNGTIWLIGILLPGFVNFVSWRNLHCLLLYTKFLSVPVYWRSVCIKAKYVPLFIAVLKTTGKYFTVANSAKKVPFVNLKICSAI